MNIDQVKHAKREIESKIMRLINEFERDTGCSVTDCRVYSIDTTMFGSQERSLCHDIRLGVAL